MKRMVLRLYTYAEFILLGLFVFLPIMAAARVFARHDPGRRARGRWMRRFGKLTSQLSPLWRFHVEGDGPHDIGDRAYVVVSNHLSTADPFLLCHLPWDMRLIAKREVFRQPVTGWLISLGSDIPLERGNRASVECMFAAARETLASGMSVMLFPEGTRSADGQLQEFKDGAFALAIESGVPVLPLAIHGTRECRPKGSKWFGEADAVVRVLEPISTQGLTAADVPRLKGQVRDRIALAATELALERSKIRRGSLLRGALLEEATDWW